MQNSSAARPGGAAEDGVNLDRLVFTGTEHASEQAGKRIADTMNRALLILKAAYLTRKTQLVLVFEATNCPPWLRCTSQA